MMDSYLILAIAAVTTLGMFATSNLLLKSAKELDRDSYRRARYIFLALLSTAFGVLGTIVIAVSLIRVVF